MPIKIYKPTTQSRRSRSSVLVNPGLKKRAVKSLTFRKKGSGGRNQQGKITMRHIGGGARKIIRMVDFRRDKLGVPGKIVALEHDPQRTALLALVQYADGDRRYIIAPEGLAVGDAVSASKERIDVKPGNAMPIGIIPAGVQVHAVELIPGKGGELARSAGLSALVAAHEGGVTHVKLPSGEVRTVADACMATIGMVSNAEWRNVRWGKAGRSRLRGIRPHVRGKAMNPVDHPHGGGEGGSPIGMKHPKTPWGKPALGFRTRRKDKKSNRFIIQRRKVAKSSV